MGQGGAKQSSDAAAAPTPQGGATGDDASRPLQEPASVTEEKERAISFLKTRTQEFHPNMDSESRRVSVRLCIAYGAPNFAKYPMHLLISIHLFPFYQNLGVGLGSLAFAMSFARCFDVLSDPIMANVTDATRTRWGRRRPYIFFGSLFYGVCLLCLASPPDAGAGLVSGWFGVFYIVFFLTDTLVNVPHNALGQEVTTDTDQRRKVFMVAKLFEGFGTLGAAVLPAVLNMFLAPACDLANDAGAALDCSTAASAAECEIFGSSGCAQNSACEFVAGLCRNSCEYAEARCSAKALVGTRQVMMISGFLFGIYAIATFIICAIVVQEKSATLSEYGAADGENQAKAGVGGESYEKPSKVEQVFPSFLSMLGNKPFLTMIGPWILDQTLAAMVGTLLPFFVTYVIAPPKLCLQPPPIPLDRFQCSDLNVLSAGVLGLLLCAVLSMPGWFWLAGKIGDYKAWLFFNFLNAITNILMVFPNQGWNRHILIGAAIIFSCLNGIPLGAKFLTENIMGICIDYDELRTGVRNEAAFTMFASFIPKVVSVPASAAPLVVLSVLGFVSPDSNGTPELHQDEGVVWGIRIMFGVIPFFMALTSFFLKLLFFPFRDLGGTDAAIKAGLLLRKEGKPYRDPLTNQFKVPPGKPPPQWERRRALINHFYQRGTIEGVLAEPFTERGKSLVNKATWQLNLSLVATVACVVGTGITMAAQLLTSNVWSWVPSLLVILAGLWILCSITSFLRLRAARALTKMELSDDFLHFVKQERGFESEASVGKSNVEQADQVKVVFEEIKEEGLGMSNRLAKLRLRLRQMGSGSSD